MTYKKILCLFFLFSIHKYFFSQSFTFAVIPDTQSYVYYKYQKDENHFINQKEILFRQIEYIKNNSNYNGGKIHFAVHLGDLVESTSNVQSEWDTIDLALSILDNHLPYLVVPGNHDCDKWIREGPYARMDGYKLYNKYFGPESKHFKNANYYCGAYNNVNSYGKFEVEDKKFLVIGLEIEPSDDVIDWVNNIIKENPNYAIILFIHEYLYYVYDQYMPGFATRMKSANLRADKQGNSPEMLWQKLIAKNKQIFLVLCGHSFIDEFGEGIRTDFNNDGYKVFQILSDYQGRASVYKNKNMSYKYGCGDGWIRLLEFNLDKKQIHVRTYSTEINKYEIDPDSDFIIKLDWNWDERFNNGVRK